MHVRLGRMQGALEVHLWRLVSPVGLCAWVATA